MGMLLRRYHEDTKAVNYGSLSVSELKDLATDKGLEFDKKVKKDELIALLEG